MSTSSQSTLNDIFHLPVQRAEKNGFRRSPINDDLTSAYTWATPQNSLGTSPGGLAAKRRSHHHDA